MGIARGRPGMSASSRCCNSVEIAVDDDALLALLLEFGPLPKCKPVLFCENDDYALFLERHSEELRRHYRFFSSSRYTMDEIINKRTMLQLAREAGLQVPASLFSEKESADTIRRHATYPCLVKPLYTSSEHRTKGEEAASKAELDAILRQSRFRANDFVLQEIVEGPPSNAVLFSGYADDTSRLLATFTCFKVRTVPKDFGMATVAVSKRVAAVEEMSERFIRHLGFRGLVDIEFKLDTRTNTYKFIEINPRPCALIGLSAAAGVDLALVAYRDAVGEKPAEIPKQKDGVEWVTILDDLATCVKYYFRHDRLVLLDWLRRTVGSDAYGVFSLRDPMPFLAKTGHMAVRRLRGSTP